MLYQNDPWGTQFTITPFAHYGSQVVVWTSTVTYSNYGHERQAPYPRNRKERRIEASNKAPRWGLAKLVARLTMEAKYGKKWESHQTEYNIAFWDFITNVTPTGPRGPQAAPGRPSRRQKKAVRLCSSPWTASRS